MEQTCMEVFGVLCVCVCVLSAQKPFMYLFCTTCFFVSELCGYNKKTIIIKMRELLATPCVRVAHVVVICCRNVCALVCLGKCFKRNALNWLE